MELPAPPLVGSTSVAETDARKARQETMLVLPLAGTESAEATLSVVAIDTLGCCSAPARKRATFGAEPSGITSPLCTLEFTVQGTTAVGRTSEPATPHSFSRRNPTPSRTTPSSRLRLRSHR